jgi:hypothetical protein
MNKKRNRVRVILGASIVGIVAICAFYIFIYQADPFKTAFFSSPDITWNDFGLNIITTLASAICASVATAVWLKHQPSEPIYKVWMYLALGLWSWFLGDLLWAIYNMAVGEVPGISVADIFWVEAYVLFTGALLHQYALLVRSSQKRVLAFVIPIWVFILVASFVVTLAAADFQFSAFTPGGFINFFYPLGNLAIAITALIFIRHFRGGAMVRPWLGLFIFAFADSLYAWLFESGVYAFSAEAGNLPSLVADTAYVLAYLVMALGCLSHYLLLQYGPGAFHAPKAAPRSLN